MKKKVSPVVKKIRHSDAYKTESLALAEKVGFAAAARQLNLHESQLYAWRVKARSQANKSGLEQELSTEIVRLKRQLAEQTEELAILKMAAAYFAKSVQ